MLSASREILVDLDQLNCEQFYHILLDKVTDGVYFVDPDRRILFWNQAAEKLTGFDAASVMGTRCADNILRHVDECGRQLCEEGCPLHETLATGKNRHAHVFLHHKQGHRVPVFVRTVPLRDIAGRIIGAVETFSDNTQRMADLERITRLEQIAFLDDLTHLANRRYLQEAMAGRLAEFTRHGSEFGVILLDLDGFKPVNDRCGHDAGDAVLRMVARTIAHNCRPYDVVGRWGGDEFLVIAGHTPSDMIDQFAERLRVLVGQSWMEEGGERLCVTTSVGATICCHGDDMPSLLKRADELLYQSKSAGRNRVTVG